MPTSSPGNSHTHDIVAKLWNLCNVLKDDGVTYHQYVSELTYLLFLKMAQETGQEQGIPEEWRWSALETLQGVKQLEHYKLMLRECGALSERALLAVSELEPERFEQQLFRELERGTAREVQANGQVLLEAVGCRARGATSRGSPSSASTAGASAGLAMGVPPAEASEYDEQAR